MVTVFPTLQDFKLCRYRSSVIHTLCHLSPPHFCQIFHGHTVKNFSTFKCHKIHKSTSLPAVLRYFTSVSELSLIYTSREVSHKQGHPWYSKVFFAAFAGMYFPFKTHRPLILKSTVSRTSVYRRPCFQSNEVGHVVRNCLEPLPSEVSYQSVTPLCIYIAFSTIMFVG